MTDIMNRKEIWRPVVGYEGLYDVSNIGRVRSLNYRGTGRVQVLKLKYARNGYLNVCLTKNGKGKTFLVHKLVWEAFNGPVPDGYELDHINTVRDDARLENLRCVTPKGNSNNLITRKRYLEAIKKRSENEEWQKNHTEALRKLHQDPEWRRKWSEANKKKTQDPEYMKRLAEGIKKRSLNEEWRKKQASAVRKVWEDPEHRKNHAEACRKRSLDEEWRRNVVEGNKKKWSDPEYRKKQAEAARKANSKPVLQIDKTTGCCMGKWDSMSAVERALGINTSNIAACCKGKYKTAGGWKWKYA